MVCISQTFGDKACHPERSEGSLRPGNEILRCAQDDRPESTHVRSREVFSPNVCRCGVYEVFVGNQPTVGPIMEIMSIIGPQMRWRSNGPQRSVQSGTLVAARGYLPGLPAQLQG